MRLNWTVHKLEMEKTDKELQRIQQERWCQRKSYGGGGEKENKKERLSI